MFYYSEYPWFPGGGQGEPPDAQNVADAAAAAAHK